MTRTPFAATWEHTALYAVEPSEGIEFPYPIEFPRPTVEGDTMLVTQVTVKFFGPEDPGAEEPFGPEIGILGRRKTRSGGVDKRGLAFPLVLRHAEKVALCERLGIDLTRPL